MISLWTFIADKSTLFIVIVILVTIAGSALSFLDGWNIKTFFQFTFGSAVLATVITSIGFVIGWLFGIGFVWLFGIDLIGSGYEGNKPHPTPVFQGEPILDILESGTSVDIVDTEVVPLYNCNNSTEYGVDIERTRSIEYVVNVGGEITSEIQHVVSLGIQGHYGVENGQTEDRSYTIHLTAAKDSWVEYTINWRYVWREGQAFLTLQDGTEEAYPYQVRSAIEFEIAQIEQKECEP